MQATANTRPNPRRVSPGNSVCLKRTPPSSKPASSNVSVASNLAANGEEERSYKKTARSQATESAKTWFDDFNKNVSTEQGSRLYGNDDPPYFLRNKSSSDDSLPNPHQAPPSTIPFFKKFPNAASVLSRNQTIESSSEEFRSVIDDLTIENRKLRKKLRKYEQVHCGGLQDDKLFEVRVHGLPASKKRKLEKALQEFAASLADTPEDDNPSAFEQKLAKVPVRKTTLHHNSSSSGTSKTFQDSAYVSMSTSSNTQGSRKDSTRKSAGSHANNDQAVRAYIRNVSRGLLPKHPPVWTERTKKQVVVQRLEQLFTGSHDNTGKNSQSKQQQEVSQSAASADRKENEAQGHHPKAEGRRESKIFTSEEEIKQGTKILLDRADTDSSEPTTTSSSATPDQRPTRPMDLDPSRAQIPEDNIEYMRHLGFASPQMQAEKSADADDGWIFLNLLTGMAQLHILNVTTEFVRTAVRDFSNVLELSTDGSRIRWKGGKRPTPMIADSGEISAHSSSYSSYDLGGLQPENSKSSISKSENRSGSGSGHNRSSNDPPSSYQTFDDRYRPLLLDQTNQADSYQYRPLFYHDNRSTDSGGHSFEEKDSSPSSGAIDSTMLEVGDRGNRGGNTNLKGARSKLRKTADPIIFYNKAKFYTDLSKDDESMPYNCPLYTKNVKAVIGVDEPSESSDREDKGPLSNLKTSFMPNLERLDSFPTLQGLTEDTQMAESSSLGQRLSMPFEASGIGGIIPGDNFAIDVEVQHERQCKGKKIATKVLSSKTTEMLPSALPPPSYAFLPFSSSSEDDPEDSESDEDVDMADEEAYEQDIKSYIPPKFLNSFSSEGSQNDSDDDDDNMSDDSSIDMLAHARELEPETVAAAEREFAQAISDSDDDEAMDIAPPASSVVVTVGDQSLDVDDTVEKVLPVSTKKTHKKPPSIGQKRSQEGRNERSKAKQRRTRA